MDARELEARAARADALAREHGCEPAPCRVCGGEGQVTIVGVGHHTRKTVFNPCFECLGLGSMWVDNQETSDWVRRLSGGLLNLEEIIQRFDDDAD
jgi:hypothetical protein